jgi:CRP/FNR family transcriptional regulator
MKQARDQLEEFFSQFRRLNYKKHEVIVRPGDTPSGMFFISRGYVKVYTLSESGQELSLIIFKPGDCFPMIWAFNDVNIIQYCEATTPVEVYRSSKDEFKKFLQSNPDVLWDVTSKILIRFQGVLERMEYMVFGSAYQKVASILVICAERFGLAKNHGIIIRVPLTHKDVANLIGLTRETTSVELKKLENARIISKKGRHIVVKNFKRLKEEAQWYNFE